MNINSPSIIVRASFFVAALVVTQASRAGIFSTEFYIFPAAPQYLEQVILRIDYSNSRRYYGGRVSMQGNKITVNVPLVADTTSPSNHDISLGSFPSGTYTVEVYEDLPFGRTDLVASREFAVANQVPQPPVQGPQIPVVNYSDMWWNPAESGRGLTIAQRSNGQLIAVWFVHDVSGKPIWYTLEPGTWTNERTFTGPIYRTDGPYFAGTYLPSELHQTAVGSGTLTFRHYDNGRFTYTVGGLPGAMDITRFVF